ncbi:unnamed protein product [Cuscuta campestris]|uniref:Uncharacterized protein n=1 Tax=Cuscuta campestris TaxID=132261 RepID=A0A484L9D0_9ASTE|nr:unnamed protein product [Cuscuta campestris]
MPRIRFSPLKIRDIRSQPRVARFFFRPSSSVEPSAYPYCQKRDDNDKGIIGIISLALDSYHRSTSHFNNICK